MIVSVNRETNWSFGRVPSALSMPSPGIAVGCQHSGPAGRLGDARWCGQPFPDSTDVSLQNTQQNASFNAVWSWNEANKSWQDLAFQAFNDPKSINREASETTLLGVTLGGWNATYFWTFFGGGNDVMVVSSWFLLCSFVFFCSGLSFWNAMIIAVVELLLSYWNVLTVDKNIGCLEDVPIFQTNVISKWWICNCYQLNTIESSVHVVSSRNKVPNTWFLLFFYTIYDQRYQSIVLILTMKLSGREESPSPIGVD